MNKIEELIQDLCPDGVEYKELGEVASILNGYSFKSSEYVESGIRIIRISDVQKGKVSNKDVKYYPFSLEKEIKKYLLRNGDLVMSLTGNTGRVAMINSSILPAGLNQRVACIRANRYLLTRYLFHLFDMDEFENEAMNNSTGGGQKNLSTVWLSKYKIPIPPLPIQQEIVNILDKFTQLEEELNAELEARREQYDFYLNQLMEFENKDVEWKALGEIGEFMRGKRFVKNDIVEDGIPCIHYGELYTSYGVWTNKTISYLESELAEKLRTAKKGDVIIVTAGETIEDIGNAVAWLGDEDVVIHDACFSFSHKQNPKYVSYYLRSNHFRSQIRRYISSGKISSINDRGLSKAKIPIPPLSEQKRIVSILDKFYALINDTTIGIQVEIDARRKQYEYYRNKLLTFEEF
jgi:type I restriction enzyme S subunit